MKSNSSNTINPGLGCPFSWLCASLLAVAGPFVATSAAQTIHTLEIDEVGESPTPVVTYDGSPVSVSGTLLKDNWTIVLPSTFDLAPVSNPVLLGEPEDSTKINSILVGTQPTTLTWQSDIAKPAGVGTFPTTIVLASAGDFTPATPGATLQVFNLVLRDEPASKTPDSSSTATLLGLAILGLLGASRIRTARG